MAATNPQDRQDAEALALIAAGNALDARIEYDLEDRGLVRQTDAPYAVITPAGQRLLDEARP